MQKGSIFSDISPAEWERILRCFQPITQKFEAGSYIMTFSEDLDRIGIMLSGKAHLTYIDADGKYTILEQLYTNDVFGEVFLSRSRSRNSPCRPSRTARSCF